jgi:hypothetical protein
MPTDADIRRWAREQGLENVPARGPVPPHIRDAWDAHHDGNVIPLNGDGPEPGNDDFGGLAEPGPPPAEDTAERKPRNIRTPRGQGLAVLRKGRGKAKAGPKKKHPRVPVDDLIATAWRALAGMARPLPATSRLLKIQAPVAGAILEDTVKGTAVDRILQPFARTTKGAEAIAVLLGPPVIVTAMQVNPDMQPFLMEPLRELMLRWCKVAGPKMREALEREREFEAEFGETVDDLLLSLFESPQAGDDPVASMQAEEAAVRAAQERVMAV